jgi:hypothetical protein
MLIYPHQNKLHCHYTVWNTATNVLKLCFFSVKVLQRKKATLLLYQKRFSTSEKLYLVFRFPSFARLSSDNSSIISSHLRSNIFRHHYASKHELLVLTQLWQRPATTDVCKPEAANTVFELLMMSDMSLETCWAIRSTGITNSNTSCWLFLNYLNFELLMMSDMSLENILNNKKHWNNKL